MEYTEIGNSELMERLGLKDIVLSMCKISIENCIPVRDVAQIASATVEEFIQLSNNVSESKEDTKEEKPSMVTVTEIGDAIKSILREKKISEKEFGKRMHLSYAKCQKLFRGETPVTMELAQQLEEVLGKPADEWMEMQLSTPITHVEEKTEIVLPKLYN